MKLFGKKKLRISKEKRERMLAVIERLYEERACSSCVHFEDAHVPLIAKSHCRLKKGKNGLCQYEPDEAVIEQNNKMFTEFENILNNDK